MGSRQSVSREIVEKEAQRATRAVLPKRHVIGLSTWERDQPVFLRSNTGVFLVFDDAIRNEHPVVLEFYYSHHTLRSDIPKISSKYKTVAFISVIEVEDAISNSDLVQLKNIVVRSWQSLKAKRD